MKTALHPFRGFFRLTVIILLTTSTSLSAQDEGIAQPAEFKISIESSKRAIKLVCLQGCDWKELHYRNSSDNILQAVNRYGMIDLTQREFLPSIDNKDFLFTIETTANSIMLKGIVGTVWKELSFECLNLQCIRVIDSYGILRPIQ